eukprot:178201-Prymnesium_polylepis.1
MATCSQGARRRTREERLRWWWKETTPVWQASICVAAPDRMPLDGSRRDPPPYRERNERGRPGVAWPARTCHCTGR